MPGIWKKYKKTCSYLVHFIICDSTFIYVYPCCSNMAAAGGNWIHHKGNPCYSNVYMGHVCQNPSKGKEDHGKLHES